MKPQGKPFRIVQFQAYSPLFEMERSGAKPFTARKIERGDDRFTILAAWFKTEVNKRDCVVVRIVNPVNNEKFCRRLDAVQYLDRAPSWVILWLGAPVECLVTREGKAPGRSGYGR